MPSLWQLPLTLLPDLELTISPCGSDRPPRKARSGLSTMTLRAFRAPDPRFPALTSTETVPTAVLCSIPFPAITLSYPAPTMDTGTSLYASTCADDDYDMAGSILHEMTHLYGTQDYAYGPDAAKKLSAAQAAANADTYEMYAGSVRLGGCS